MTTDEAMAILNDTNNEYGCAISNVISKNNRLDIDFSLSLTFGCYVYLYSLKGRILFLLDLISSRDANQGIIEHSLIDGNVEAWNHYVTLDQAGVFACVKNDFKQTGLEWLRRTLDTKVLLNEINELELFCDKRDELEFFLRGIETEDSLAGLKNAINALDAELQKYVIKVVVPNLTVEWCGSETVLSQDDADFPVSFWWRHLRCYRPN